MTASLGNPVYTVIIKADGTEYNLSNVFESLSFTDQQKQFAQSVTIQIANQEVNGSWLSSLLKVRSRVFIYADDGTTKAEVFRGFVWTRSYGSANDGKCLTLKCYDHLIYMQESEDYRFFASGRSTEDVINSICKDWGVNLDYSYSSITNSQLVLRGNLADIFTADVLDLVKKRTGKKYVIRSEKDVMKIMHVGKNATVYHLKRKENVINTSSECTMDGMITKVIILGKEEKNERAPVEGTAKGDTATYGTLQKVINKSENESLADAQKEAQSLIDENGKPKWTYEVEAVDIPWIRKGDKVYVNAGDMVDKNYIVIGVDRAISNSRKTMVLTVENE